VPQGGSQRYVVPPDYVLGAGDLIEVTISGRTDVQRASIVIAADGSIVIPPLGSIAVAGMTTADANKRITARAREYFRFADVSTSLVWPRLFEVAVTGEVNRPQSVLVSSARRLQDAIAGAGGVTTRGSMRKIQITSEGKTTEYDLLKFELGGDLTQNPLVREGMSIFVPPRLATATLSGAFRRNGEFELVGKSSLSELAALTGGFGDYAVPQQARLTRIMPSGRRETVTVDLKAALTRPADVLLQPGDVIFVPSITPLQDLIELRGAFVGGDQSAKSQIGGKVAIIQRLELAEGDRIRDVVGRVGGTTPIADLRLAFIDRSSSAGPSQRIPVDLHKLYVEKDESQNIPLENGDVFALPAMEDKIFINGEVKGAGAADFRPEWTARDYIANAGGFALRAKPEAAFVTFRNGKTYKLTDAPVLEPGATIVIPEVSVKWWQDYITISNTILGLISAYVGLYVLFGGTTANINLFGTTTGTVGGTTTTR
jgi:polysaccharide export outer membrane protein